MEENKLMESNDEETVECTETTTKVEINDQNTINDGKRKGIIDRPIQLKRIKIDDNQNIYQMNENLLTCEFIHKFQNHLISYNERDGLNDVENPTEIQMENLTFYQKPFQICTISDFFKNPNVIHELLNEILDLEFHTKHMDLYRFNQSTDLINYDHTKYLNQFLCYLKTDVLQWLSKVYNINLTHVSASVSMYTVGDYLLAHDDRLSDRQIAFVYYLSPWPMATTWNSKMGGALELFQVNDDLLPEFPICKAIHPKNNQFLFFKVSDKSFHQVGEITNLDFPRLTINGWFHSSMLARATNDDNTNPVKSLICDKQWQSPNKTVDSLAFINDFYLSKPKEIEKIQHQMEHNSECALFDFLSNTFYQQIETELKSINDSCDWIKCGPANYRNYEILNLLTVTDNVELSAINSLVKMFTSMNMFELLYKYTELDLYGCNAKSPSYHIEIRRLTPSCYKVVNHEHLYSFSTLDLIMYFGDKKDDFGSISYIDPNGDRIQSKADDNEKEQNGNDEDKGDIDDDDDNDDNTIVVEDTIDGDGDDEDIDEENYDEDEDEDEDNANCNLLTIQPNRNVLNMVFRTSGTAEIINYISKMYTNEYVYMLVANYKQ